LDGIYNKSTCRSLKFTNSNNVFILHSSFLLLLTLLPNPSILVQRPFFVNSVMSQNRPQCLLFFVYFHQNNKFKREVVKKCFFWTISTCPSSKFTISQNVFIFNFSFLSSHTLGLSPHILVQLLSFINSVTPQNRPQCLLFFCLFWIVLVSLFFTEFLLFKEQNRSLFSFQLSWFLFT
jgi:hypothetical protein